MLVGRIGSWDEAFGRPFPKGTHLKEYRQRRKLRLAISVRVNQIRTLNTFDKNSPPPPIRLGEPNPPAIPFDDGYFEQVGEEFGIKKSLAKKLYYESKRQHAKLRPRKP